MPISIPSIPYIQWTYYKTWCNNILHFTWFWLTYLAWFGRQVAAGSKEEVWSSFKSQRIRFNEFRALPMFLLLALMVVFVVSGVPKTCQKRRVSSPAADATVYPSGLWKKQLIREKPLVSNLLTFPCIRGLNQKHDYAAHSSVEVFKNWYEERVCTPVPSVELLKYGQWALPSWP
jgi:hypothetical protein